MNVIIPAYKPDQCLLDLVAQIHAQTDFRIIVVNDGSGAEFDPIFDALPDYCTLLSHEINCGKGKAMKTAFAYLLQDQNKKDGAVIIDADGQHLLPDVIRVCNALNEHPDSIIIGARKFTGKVPLRSRFGNSLTRWIFALASGVKLSDTQTGLRAIPRKYFKDMLQLKGNRYEFEMEMLLYAAEAKIPMHEVTIETVYINENESSHFNVIKDSARIYGVIFKQAVFFKYLCSSLFAFLIDFILLYVFKWCTASMENARISLLISVVSARVISSFCNYLINKRIVFKYKSQVGKTLLQYYLLCAIILGLNYGMLSLLTTVLSFPLFWAKLLTEVVLFTLSFFIQKLFVFKKKPNSVN